MRRRKVRRRKRRMSFNGENFLEQILDHSINNYKRNTAFMETGRFISKEAGHWTLWSHFVPHKALSLL
jgi:hypothetical protein